MLVVKIEYSKAIAVKITLYWYCKRAEEYHLWAQDKDSWHWETEKGSWKQNPSNGNIVLAGYSVIGQNATLSLRRAERLKRKVCLAASGVWKGR